jgi:alanine dehydrogenase
MVGHEAVRIDLADEFTFEKQEIVSIKVEIVAPTENSLPVMAPLNDMMRSVWKNYPS